MFGFPAAEFHDSVTGNLHITDAFFTSGNPEASYR